VVELSIAWARWSISTKLPPPNKSRILFPLSVYQMGLVSGSVCGRLFWPPVQRGVHRFWFGGCPENAYHGVV
jgi:hypothetical protein